MKDGTYIINLEEYESTRIHWIALYVNGDSLTYFHSFGIEYILKEVNKIIGSKIS